MHTNGGARDVEWWRDVAKTLGNSNKVVFSIDGLRDTNSIYRIGVQWDILMRNAEAFISSGGHAVWEFVVSRHNEHQIELAKAMARELGFCRFNLVQSERFFDFARLECVDGTPVVDRTGREVGRIELPRQQLGQHSFREYMRRATVVYGTAMAYLDTLGIRCEAAGRNEIYITAEGNVVPYCWFGHLLYMGGDTGRLTYMGSDFGAHFRTYQLLQKYLGAGRGNARIHPLRTIIDNSFYNGALFQTWQRPGVAEGKPLFCSLVCGRPHV
jgi:hypothetical protein